MNDLFATLRARWFVEHWHVDTGTADRLALNEQQLRVLFTPYGPIACEFHGDLHDAREWLSRQPECREQIELLLLLYRYRDRLEEHRRSITPCFETSYVYAPYVPPIDR